MQASGSCSEISRKSPPQEVTQLELLLQKSSKACPKETLLVGAWEQSEIPGGEDATNGGLLNPEHPPKKNYERDKQQGHVPGGQK